MPELIEVEQYRAAIDPLVGHVLDSVKLRDEGFLRPTETPAEVLDQLAGTTLTSTRRFGKLLILDLANVDDDNQFALGLRFGMTGRLLIDGSGPIDALEYASAKNDPLWDRVVISIAGRHVSIRDQRRLGSIELDPDTERLGVEASTISSADLEKAIGRRSKPLKALLLDQAIVCGLGNLLVDETLWQIGVSPHRGVDTLDSEEIAAVAAEVRATVDRLTERGGSHTGDSFDLRSGEAPCTHCGTTMRHDTVGGRSTWWCDGHQR